VRIAEYTGADGRMQFVGRLPVFPESCVAARVRLKRAGALLPDHPLDIPAIAPPPAQELPPENASPSMGNSS